MAPTDSRAPRQIARRGVVLVPEARLSGRVVSEVPGVAVSGLSVQIWTGSLDEVTTDAEGRFEARGLKAGRVPLL